MGDDALTGIKEMGEEARKEIGEILGIKPFAPEPAAPAASEIPVEHQACGTVNAEGKCATCGNVGSMFHSGFIVDHMAPVKWPIDRIPVVIALACPDCGQTRTYRGEIPVRL